MTTYVKALRMFYGQLGAGCLETFESRLARWVKHSGDGWLDFVGELLVAERLRRHNVSHCFLKEPGDAPVPDLELDVSGTKVYFEVATIRQDAFYRFFRTIQLQLEGEASGAPVYVSTRYMKPEAIDTAAERAVASIHAALSEGRLERIVHRDFDVGYSYTITFVPLTSSDKQWTQVLGGRGRLPARAQEEDETPWPEWKLTQTLEEKQGQLRTFLPHPTFLVCRCFEPSLEASDFGAPGVLGQYHDVAGVIVDDSVNGWSLFPNPAAPARIELERKGLFDDIQAWDSEVMPYRLCASDCSPASATDTQNG